MKIKKIGFLFLRLIITILLLYFVYAKIDKKMLLSIFSSGKIYLLLIALFIFILSNITGAMQWFILLKNHKLNIKFFYIIKLYLSSAFFNSFMPSNIGGDVFKAYKFIANKKKAEIAFSSIIWDRFVSLYILLLFISFTSIFIIKTYLIFSTFIFISILIILLLKYITTTRLKNKILNLIKKEKYKNFLKEFFLSFRYYFILNKINLSYYILAMFTQFLKIFINYFIILYMNLKINIFEIYFFIPIVGIISMLPISINGIGLRESIGSYLFSYLNQNKLMISLLFSIGNIIITLGNSLGIIFLFSKEKKN